MNKTLLSLLLGAAVFACQPKEEAIDYTKMSDAERRKLLLKSPKTRSWSMAMWICHTG